MNKFTGIFKGGYIAVLLLAVLYACSPKATTEIEKTGNGPLIENIDFDLSMISIKGDIQPFDSEITIDTVDVNKYLINLNLYTDFPSPLPKFQLNIKYPQNMIHALWSARTWSNLSFINIPNYSRLQSDYSLVSALTSESKNRISMGTYDQFQSRFTQIDVQHIPDSLVFSFNFFNDAVPDAELLEYKTQILVDLSDKNYSNSVREISQWRLDKDEKKKVSKIDLSLQPVYSVWYPMDRNIPLENITYYFDSISSMGFRSILFDDAWQNVVRFQVDQDGMWDPSDITTVQEFMDKARESKMKVALWYAQPFIGAHRYVFEKFDGKYLQYRTSSQPTLDIRYPEVREYLTQMYTRIITEWSIDGIWFNYLNGYYPDEQIIITDDKGRDFVSVRKALDSLRTQMEYEMLYANPELSINQSYPAVGPLHTSNTRTINGFLGVTALQDVREKMVNNRLLYGEYSPFMEVMGIHPKDAPIDLARKFQSIIFATPYISYFSYTLPEELQKTLRFWIRYWKTNTEFLMESDFKAFNPVQRYPVIVGGNEKKNILVFYERVAPHDFGYFDFEQADVINSSSYPMVSIKGTPTGKVDYIVYDHKGDYITRGTLSFKREIAQLEIPTGGYARLIVK